MIYLDNASTTMIDPEVLDAMMPYLTYEYGNAGTLYDLGFSAKRAVERAREQVAEFLGAESPENIIFTSGGTESNNMVFNSYRVMEEERFRVFAHQKRGVVVSAIEHDSVLRAADMLTKSGFDVRQIKPDSVGAIHPTELGNMILPDGNNVGLVSVMYMNNEIGTENHIHGLAEVAHKAGALFHSDCVQAAGCIEIEAKDFDVDFISISSHKIHGPKGVGALYVKNIDAFSPMIVGGASQEFGLRGGTENVAGVVGLGKASELCSAGFSNGSANFKVTACKRTFWNTLHKEMAKLGLDDVAKDNAISSVVSGKTLSVRFDGVDAEALVLMLGTRGVYISAGSACTSHEQRPSHVLLGIGMSEEEARSTVRFSFSRTNTIEESGKAAKIVADAVKELLDKESE